MRSQRETSLTREYYMKNTVSLQREVYPHDFYIPEMES